MDDNNEFGFTKKAGRPPGAKNKVKEDNLPKRKPGRPPMERVYLDKPLDIKVRGPGKPSYYEPWMCDKIIEVAARGGHISEMCVELGLKSETSYHDWKKLYPEFKEATETAKLYSKAYYEKLNLQGARGELPGFNGGTMEKIMQAKFSEEYKKDNNGNTNNRTEITINNLNLSPQEVNMKIAQLTEKLKAMGQDIGIPVVEQLEHNVIEGVLGEVDENS